MSMVDDYNLLGLGKLTSLVTNVNVSLWGAEVSDLEADLIGISLGEEAHQKPAVICTDIFEISVLYSSFSVHNQKAKIQ